MCELTSFQFFTLGGNFQMCYFATSRSNQNFRNAVIVYSCFTINGLLAQNLFTEQITLAALYYNHYANNILFMYL